MREITLRLTEKPSKTLKEFLAELVEKWEGIPIRVFQDGEWKALYLSEIKNGQVILDWIKSTEGRFWT